MLRRIGLLPGALRVPPADETRDRDGDAEAGEYGAADDLPEQRVESRDLDEGEEESDGGAERPVSDQRDALQRAIQIRGFAYGGQDEHPVRVRCDEARTCDSSEKGHSDDQ